MRYASMVGLLVLVCTVSMARGESRKPSGKADLLAQEMMSKVVYRTSNVLAHVEECRLLINFETLNAAFDLPLQGTAVEQTLTADGIVVTNKNMTRTVKGRAPEPFEQLTLHFHHDSIQPMLKLFQDAIASCGKGSLVAATH